MTINETKNVIRIKLKPSESYTISDELQGKAVITITSELYNDTIVKVIKDDNKHCEINHIDTI